MAIAGCEQPGAGWKTLVFRDDLRFFNSNNAGDLLRVLDHLVPVTRYHNFLKAVENDFSHMKHRRRSFMRSTVQSKITLAQDAIMATADYTVYGALYPFAMALIIAEHALEAFQQWQPPPRPPWPDDLFGIRVIKARGDGSYLPRRYTQGSVSSQRRGSIDPPAYSPRPSLPRYSVVDWGDDGIEDSNERWILDVYGYESWRGH